MEWLLGYHSKSIKLSLLDRAGFPLFQNDFENHVVCSIRFQLSEQNRRMSGLQVRKIIIKDLKKIETTIMTYFKTRTWKDSNSQTWKKIKFKGKMNNPMFLGSSFSYVRSNVECLHWSWACYFSLSLLPLEWRAHKMHSMNELSIEQQKFCKCHCRNVQEEGWLGKQDEPVLACFYWKHDYWARRHTGNVLWYLYFWKHTALNMAVPLVSYKPSKRLWNQMSPNQCHQN